MNRHREGYFKEYYATHKNEHRIAQEKYDKKNPRVHVPDSLQESRLKYLYKWTKEQYSAKLKDQNGHCALCLAVQGTHKRRMAVDHDHSCCPGAKTCGKCNRGILCANCNRMLGFLEETLKESSVNPQPNTWTARAIAYLKSYEKLPWNFTDSARMWLNIALEQPGSGIRLMNVQVPSVL